VAGHINIQVPDIVADQMGLILRPKKGGRRFGHLPGAYPQVRISRSMCSPPRALGANPGDKSPACMFEHELHLPQFLPKVLSLNAAWINDLLRMPFIHPKWIWKRVVAPLDLHVFLPRHIKCGRPQWRVRPEPFKSSRPAREARAPPFFQSLSFPPAALKENLSYNLPHMDCFA
jgi:hypothetical protein